MTREDILREWKESAEAAMDALRFLMCAIRDAERGYVRDDEEVNAIWGSMADNGLEGWLDINPAGGGADMLVAALKDEEPDEDEELLGIPEERLLQAIFGGEV